METNEQFNLESSLNSLFDENEKSHQKFVKKTKEEILAPYFVPRNATEIFRILPNAKGEFFSVAHFHYIKVGNRYQKLYCPKHNDGTECALCKVVDAIADLEAKNDPGSVVRKKIFEKKALSAEEKVIADKNTQLYNQKKKWAAAKYYILRGIDKQSIKDGVKFWRFKFNKKKEGVMDKLNPLLKQYQQFIKHNPLDLKTGCDLLLTVTDAAMPGTTRTYKNVTAINYRGPIALIEDEAIFSTLVADQKTWKEIFTKKNPPHITYEQYLTLITKNQAPYYDETDPKNKRWVYPGNPELELKANTRTAQAGAQSPNAPEEEFDEDEMTMNSFSPQQMSQHKGVEVTSGSLVDSILSNNVAAPSSPVVTGSAPASTPTSTPTLQTGNVDVSDDILKNLPF
jgi:hypothetical protein